MFFSIYTITTVRSDLAARAAEDRRRGEIRAIETTSADTIEGAGFRSIISKIRERFIRDYSPKYYSIFYTISRRIDWNINHQSVLIFKCSLKDNTSEGKRETEQNRVITYRGEYRNRSSVL